MKILNRASTQVKDASKLECFCGQLDVCCKIVGASSTQVVAETPTYTTATSSYEYQDNYSFSMEDSYYESGDNSIGYWE